MLRITNQVMADEVRWILSGRLAGAWVAEFRSNWDHTRDITRSRRQVIDLSDVISIDERGEGLLGELKSEGAEFVARGVYIRHLLEQLKG